MLFSALLLLVMMPPLSLTLSVFVLGPDLQPLDAGYSPPPVHDKVALTGITRGITDSIAR